MIFCINLLYVLYWLFTVYGYGLKLLKITPRYAHLYKCLTCGHSAETEDNDAKVGQEGAGQLDGAEDDEDLEKIDMLIQHLADVQQAIVEGKPAFANGGAPRDPNFEAVS